MRIIDADELLTERRKSKYYHLANGDIAIPIIDIEHAPTIDAVEVVRCKDCKYYTSISAHCEIRGKGLYLIRGMNDFCSRAERRSDG